MYEFLVVKAKVRNALFWSHNMKYNYHIFGSYPSSCLLFKTRRFGDRILSPSSGGTYSIGRIDRTTPRLRRRRLALPIRLNM
jgi:hypothetical protein